MITLDLITTALDADIQAFLSRESISVKTSKEFPLTTEYWLLNLTKIAEKDEERREIRVFHAPGTSLGYNDWNGLPLQENASLCFYASYGGRIGLPEKIGEGHTCRIADLATHVWPTLIKFVAGEAPKLFSKELRDKINFSGIELPQRHDSKVINAKVYEQAEKLKNSLGKQLTETNLLDPKILEFIVKYFYKGIRRDQLVFNLELYNWTWRNWEGLQEVLEKAPQAMPWMHIIVRNTRREKRTIKRESTDRVYNYTTGKYENQVKLAAVDLEFPAPGHPNLMDKVKTSMESFLKIKDRPKLWKTFLKLKKHEAAHLEYHRYHFPHSFLLEFKRDHGIMPKVTACEALSEWWRGQTNKENPLTHRLLFAALEASSKAANVKQWVENEFLNIRDWWENDGQYRAPDNTHSKVEWKWFNRQAVAWHRQIQTEARVGTYTPEVKAKLEAKDTWTALIAAIQIPERNAIAIPLLSRDALTEEGKSMKHCVASYANKCLQDPAVSRLFSIRKLDTGERMATCQIVRVSTEGKWHLEQIRGLNDHIVMDSIREIGHAVAIAYVQAQQTEDRRLREIEEAERKRLEAIEKAIQDAANAARKEKEAREAAERKRVDDEAAAKKKAAEEERKLKELQVRDDAKGLLARSEVITEIPDHIKALLEKEGTPTVEALTEEARAKNAAGRYGENNNVDAAQLVRNIEENLPNAV